MANIITQKLYYMPRPNRWQKGVGAELPEAYKKFWKEWKLTQPQPVHYIPKKNIFERNDKTGEVYMVQNVPIPLKYPKEIDHGLWGGEGIIQGFVKKAYDRRRVPKFWVPPLKMTVIYSEVLDKYIKVNVTDRARYLIHENYGLDFYLLNTLACDLRSLLALKLKKEILIALYDKSLYPNDSEKREEIYNKYKSYLSKYNREDLEWYGLTYKEAVKKHVKAKQEEELKNIIPLKHLFREKLIEALKTEDAAETNEDKEKRQKSWLFKLNPFSKYMTV